MCTARKGVKDLPILAQGLPASGVVYPPSFWRVYPPSFWRAVLGKVAAVKRNAN